MMHSALCRLNAKLLLLLVQHHFAGGKTTFMQLDKARTSTCKRAAASSVIGMASGMLPLAAFCSAERMALSSARNADAQTCMQMQQGLQG